MLEDKTNTAWIVIRIGMPNAPSNFIGLLVPYLLFYFIHKLKFSLNHSQIVCSRYWWKLISTALPIHGDTQFCLKTYIIIIYFSYLKKIIKIKNNNKNKKIIIN